MTRVALALDQLYRPQPGGVATYVRGLVSGLQALGTTDLDLVGVVPRGRPSVDLGAMDLSIVRAPASVTALTRLWGRWPLGVPSDAHVVHASSLAGPFSGGRRHAVHSVAVHDLLWRDEPDASTPRGVSFHERRLRLLERHDEVRVLTTSPGLAVRLVGEGFAPERLFEVGLGVDDAGPVAPEATVRAALAERGVHGPFTLYAGTREPRKNLERLREAHAAAFARNAELGPLVLVGPGGWGDVDDGEAVVLGLVSRELVKGLVRGATLLAYVPLREGFGLPPVEALHQGTRVVASRTTPSVAHNTEAVLVDPASVDEIAEGLLRALAQPDDDAARERRRDSVAALTWRNVALAHLASWQ